ncbi:MAG TPA: hypothetical protein QF708_04540, partial [Candidatus Poseidoniia archaeon]|nr:hypothetical protein [Candidatus Poseidoniia archaeon]
HKKRWMLWLRIGGGLSLLVLGLLKLIFGWGAVLPGVLAVLAGTAFLVEGLLAIRRSTPASQPDK